MPFKLLIFKKVVPDFRQREIFTVKGNSPLPLNYDISLAKTFLKIDYNMVHNCQTTD